MAPAGEESAALGSARTSGARKFLPSLNSTPTSTPAPSTSGSEASRVTPWRLVSDGKGHRATYIAGDITRSASGNLLKRLMFSHENDVSDMAGSGSTRLVGLARGQSVPVQRRCVKAEYRCERAGTAALRRSDTARSCSAAVKRRRATVRRRRTTVKRRRATARRRCATAGRRRTTARSRSAAARSQRRAQRPPVPGPVFTAAWGGRSREECLHERVRFASRCDEQSCIFSISYAITSGLRNPLA